MLSYKNTGSVHKTVQNLYFFTPFPKLFNMIKNK